MVFNSRPEYDPFWTNYNWVTSFLFFLLHFQGNDWKRPNRLYRFLKMQIHNLFCILMQQLHLPSSKTLDLRRVNNQYTVANSIYGRSQEQPKKIHARLSISMRGVPQNCLHYHQGKRLANWKSKQCTRFKYHTYLVYK